jgi:hypothetical protein
MREGDEMELRRDAAYLKQAERERKREEERNLLNIIKRLRDYIANPNIPVEDSDTLYHEHLDLADSVLPVCNDSDSDSDSDSSSTNSVYEPLENYKGTICRVCGDDIDWQNEDFFIDNPADKTQILCGDCHEEDCS